MSVPSEPDGKFTPRPIPTEADISALMSKKGIYVKDPKRVVRQIYIHHTEGWTGQDAYDTFKRNEGQVSTPFIINRNGSMVNGGAQWHGFPA